MIRMRVKHVIWGSVLLVVVVLGVQGILAEMKGNSWWGSKLMFALSSKDDQARALYGEAMNDSELPYDELIIYVGHDQSSFSRGDKNNAIMSLGDKVSKLERLIQEYPRSSIIVFAKESLASLYMLQHRWEESAQLYEELIESAHGNYTSDQWEKQLQLLRSRESKDDAESGAPMLTGTVMLGDRPLAGAQVSLLIADANSWHMPPIVGNDPIVLTDDQGQFRFYDIAPNTYDIIVGAPIREIGDYTYSYASSRSIKVERGKTADQVVIQFNPNMKVISPRGKVEVKGEKLELAWESYEGAAYYKLQLSEMHVKDQDVSTQTFTLDEKYTDNKAVLDLTALRGRSPDGWAVGWSSEQEMWVTPSYILGYGYPGSKYIWSVEAYNKWDEKISSTRSVIIEQEEELPLLMFAGDEIDTLSVGDRHVLQGEYEEAKRAYEQEPENDHALRILAMFSQHGIQYGGKDIDMNQALAYLKRIKHPTEQDLLNIQSCMEALDKKNNS